MANVVDGVTIKKEIEDLDSTDGQAKNQNGQKLAKEMDETAASESSSLSSHLEKQTCVCNVSDRSFLSNVQVKTRICTGDYALVRSMLLIPPPKEKTFNCEVCDKIYRCKSGLQFHMLKHTDIMPYVCKVCNKGYSSKRSFDNHVLMHSEENLHRWKVLTHSTKKKSHICDICKKEYSYMSHLRMHCMSHTGEKPYSCELCNKTFSARSNLKNHYGTHTKPYICDTCNKAFSSESYLKRHEETHLTEVSHFCEVCNKGFILKGQLEAHLLMHMPGIFKEDKDT